MTSRPIIVTSIPLSKTRRAASGSAQMLNSAAGVRFPSPIEPPISTIRSGRASGSSASSRAMFVSGPVGTSVELPLALSDPLGDEGDGVLVDGVHGRRRQLGPVEAALAVDVRRDRAAAHERPVGARGDRNIAATGELEHLERVRGRLLERLVAGDRRDADELELRRGEREQERDRVVVAGVAVEDDRRRRHMCLQPGSSSFAVRKRALRAERGGGEGAGGAGAGGAPPRRSAPSSSETTRHAVNASPAPVPSTGDDLGAARARDLLAVLVQHRAVLAVRDRDELPALDHLVLEPVDDEQVGLERRSRGRARR